METTEVVSRSQVGLERSDWGQFLMFIGTEANELIRRLQARKNG